MGTYNITPVEILISLNLIWIGLVSTLGLLVYKASKQRVSNLEKFVQDIHDSLESDYLKQSEFNTSLNGIGKRIESEIKQEDLKATGCRTEVNTKLAMIEHTVEDFINNRFVRFLKSYSSHKHSKDSGRVEGGDFI